MANMNQWNQIARIVRTLGAADAEKLLRSLGIDPNVFFAQMDSAQSKGSTAPSSAAIVQPQTVIRETQRQPSARPVGMTDFQRAVAQQITPSAEGASLEGQSMEGYASVSTEGMDGEMRIKPVDAQLQEIHPDIVEMRDDLTHLKVSVRSQVPDYDRLEKKSAIPENTAFHLDFSQDALLNGLILSEILGAPRGRNRRLRTWPSV